MVERLLLQALAEVTTQMKLLSLKYTIIKLSARRTLLPGFIDPHVHILLKGMMIWDGMILAPLMDKTCKKNTYNLKWLEQQIQNFNSNSCLDIGKDCGFFIDAIYPCFLYVLKRLVSMMEILDLLKTN